MVKQMYVFIYFISFSPYLILERKIGPDIKLNEGQIQLKVRLNS